MTYLLLGAAVVILSAAIWLIRSRSVAKRFDNASSSLPSPRVAKEPIIETDSAERIVIGDVESQPLITIESTQDFSAFQMAAPISQGSKQISKLSAYLQAVPSMLVANEAAGKNLMEVVVNGDLVRASDGNGLRAYVMGPNGIKEHARLFEVQQLQNMINAAAVWQLASVVVAQKHLADINAKLQNIEKGIDGISRFLDHQRKARIQSSYEYLRQVSAAISDGDSFPTSVRNQLESIERDLLEIQSHLEMDFRNKSLERVKDSDSFGTESLTENLVKKVGELDALTHDMALCLQTRIAASHVLALYPGEAQLKKIRQENIQRDLKQLRELVPHIDINLRYDSKAIDSMFNRKTTLEERRARVERSANDASFQFSQRLNLCRDSLESTETLLRKDEKPMRILFSVEDGRVTEARQLHV